MSPRNSATDNDDLLAEREAAEFEASVRAARERKAARSQKDAAPISQDLPNDDIQWAEQEDVYRPVIVKSEEYLASLALTLRPGMNSNESVILIRDSAVEAAQNHLRTDKRIELGGLLAGQPLYDPVLDRFIVVVEAAFPALHGECTSTTFSYTAASWQALLPQLKQMNSAWTIVGSYHSHPGLGIFLSSTDKETQADVFPHDWQIALVIDPVAETAGYFIGVNGKPCRAYTLKK